MLAKTTLKTIFKYYLSYFQESEDKRIDKQKYILFYHIDDSASYAPCTSTVISFLICDKLKVLISQRYASLFSK